MTRFRRFVTKKYFLYVSALSVIAMIYLYNNRIKRKATGEIKVNGRYNLSSQAEKYCAEPITKSANDEKNFGKCHIPTINPFNADAMAIMKDQPKITCRTVKRATLSGGKLTIFGTDVIKASYETIHRTEKDDFKWRIKDPITVVNNTALISHEFIKLNLELKNGDTINEYLFQVVRKPEVTGRKQSKSELDLNMVIFAMDSLSHGHAQRKLPKTYAYIRDVLQGHAFMGHSAVGDGTTEQLAALLSGKGEREQPEARRNQPGAQVVDGWDWIFRRAKGEGYVTSYVEDTPSIGSFNYRLKGFRDPPTDIYPRAFFLVARRDRKAAYEICCGSEKLHNFHFDLMRKFYEQYPDRGKLLFHFTDLTHGNFNKAQYVDEDLFNLLKEFEKKSYLNNTLFIVMGDHGWRYGEFRQTVQGKLEERLPLFAMILPKWFKQKYPKLDKNLKTNTERLTSWYDAYATLRHMLVYPNEAKGVPNGKSLLTELPEVRSCKDAHIPSHWCPCLQWTAVNTQHDHVQRAVLEAVRYINDLNSREPLAVKHCRQLEAYKIKHAEVETPSNEVLKFSKSGHDGYDPIYRGGAGNKNQCKYQITFQTSPNNGIYEVTVAFVKGTFSVKGGISRINAYGDQPKCIADMLPHLRKYCFCKQHIS